MESTHSVRPSTQRATGTWHSRATQRSGSGQRPLDASGPGPMGMVVTVGTTHVPSSPHVWSRSSQRRNVVHRSAGTVVQPTAAAAHRARSTTRTCCPLPCTNAMRALRCTVVIAPADTESSSSTPSPGASRDGSTANVPRSATPSARRTAGRATENESLCAPPIDGAITDPARRTRAVSCSVDPGRSVDTDTTTYVADALHDSSSANAAKLAMCSRR